jgi:predicted dehydrogenase
MSQKQKIGVGIIGCGNISQAYFNGAMLESACCESENYAGMKKAVEALGLAGMPNTNYLIAAKRVMGMLEYSGK